MTYVALIYLVLTYFTYLAFTSVTYLFFTSAYFPCLPATHLPYLLTSLIYLALMLYLPDTHLPFSPCAHPTYVPVLNSLPCLALT